MKYEQHTTERGVDFIIKQNNDGSTTWIPTEPNNSDYQAYLKSLEGAN